MLGATSSRTTSVVPALVVRTCLINNIQAATRNSSSTLIASTSSTWKQQQPSGVGSSTSLFRGSRRFASSWVSPSQRNRSSATRLPPPQLASASGMKRRPLVNGKAVAFHVNDLKAADLASHTRLFTDDYEEDDWGVVGGFDANTAMSFSSLLSSANANTTTRRSSTTNDSSSSRRQQQNRKTQYDSDMIVVLDLDECLIHAQFLDSPTAASVYAHQLRHQHSQHHKNNTASSSNHQKQAPPPPDSFRFQLPNLNHTGNHNNATMTGPMIHVHIRPGLIEFLRHVTARYETHIYTAAIPAYADPILDYLSSAVSVAQNRKESSATTDASAPIFAGRWYRQHCIYDANAKAYVKDLSKIGGFADQLDKTVLIDNNPLSFKHPENGILVSSFYTDGADTTLATVRDVLDELEAVDDVRPVLLNQWRLAINAAAMTASPQEDFMSVMNRFLVPSLYSVPHQLLQDLRRRQRLPAAAASSGAVTTTTILPPPLPPILEAVAA